MPKVFGCNGDCASKWGRKFDQRVGEISGFMMYVHGFQTAYNRWAPNTYDVFEKLSGTDVLISVEAWCGNHPTKAFGQAVLAVAESIRNEK